MNMSTVPPLAEALEKYPGVTPIGVTGDPMRVVVYSQFPLPTKRKEFIQSVAGEHPVGFYSFFCVKKKNFEDKYPPLEYDKYASDALKKVNAKVLVLIRTQDPKIDGKHCVKLSNPPSLKEDAGNDQRKFTELWEAWFKQEWPPVLESIETHVQTTGALKRFFECRTGGDSGGRDKKVAKTESLRCVEEPLKF